MPTLGRALCFCLLAATASPAFAQDSPDKRLSLTIYNTNLALVEHERDPHRALVELHQAVAVDREVAERVGLCDRRRRREDDDAGEHGREAADHRPSSWRSRRASGA